MRKGFDGGVQYSDSDAGTELGRTRELVDKLET